jgi:hypothetical protein
MDVMLTKLTDASVYLEARLAPGLYGLRLQDS